MNFVDRYSLILHRAIAEKMLRDEERILRIARSNLDRWLKKESFAGSTGIPLREWQQILENSTSAQIRRILTADTDESQRLRSSSPFTGILTKAERDKYWSECAEVGLV